jgi:hypothetical protein
MREDCLQNQKPEGLPALTCCESDPDQAGGPKTGMSVPVEPPDDEPEEGNAPEAGLPVSPESETN